MQGYQDMVPMATVVTQPAMVRRVACSALVEDEYGHRWMEPMLYLSVADIQCWLNDDLEWGPIVMHATLGDASLPGVTRNGGDRTMLASEWIKKAVVESGNHSRAGSGYQGRSATHLWSYVLVSPSPPSEFGFTYSNTYSDEFP